MSTSTPSTTTLDHIVHLTSPESLLQTADQFRDLGFTVVPGGTHTHGLTANSLVVLADGVYLELICFTHPSSYYPPGSPERLARDSHEWANKDNGWIDFAFLGNGSLITNRISDIINERAKKEGHKPIYSAEHAGGRKRTDGEELEWVISNPIEDQSRGILPFFCGDVTSRKLRVPSEPPSNIIHPCKAIGISHLIILTTAENFDSLLQELTWVIGEKPVIYTDESGKKEPTWQLLSAHHKAQGPKLVLKVPRTVQHEAQFIEEHRTGIYEVGFFVTKSGGGSANTSTPYGKISWVPVDP